eukprot:TRINITY_DN801_c0_g1_i3.p1 TRINITY_DN801_c0_g1~~TRINITY_DN801_c0_g1_i3.p1  ORF type:complete len:726 (-),score=233.16 TRINITY_DN801_c0_g1_i3:421-2517(-)
MTGAGGTSHGRCRFVSWTAHYDHHSTVAFVSAAAAAAVGGGRPRALSTAERCRHRPSGPLRTGAPAIGSCVLPRPRACASAVGGDAPTLPDGKSTGAPAPASVALAAAVLPTLSSTATSRRYHALAAAAAAVRQRQRRWRALLRALRSVVAGGGSRLRRLAVAGLAALVVMVSSGLRSAVAAGPTLLASAGAGLKPPTSRPLVVLGVVLFFAGAALAAAETAITTLWPWKVRELADKEGVDSPFAVLEKDLTRFLTTILVATTTATVFSTAMVTELAGELLGNASVGLVTAGMTVVFLFFGEILPKALAVHSPAKVARVMVPVISAISVILYPLGKILAFFSTLILRLFNVAGESNAAVSEEELRLIVAGADRSGSIAKYESQIIQNVLDLEEKAVREVMCPRVDMVAVPSSATLMDMMNVERESHYSRMPVYDGSIDNIIGVVYAKSLLEYLVQQPEELDRRKVLELVDMAYFIPESMTIWTVLEQMRKRRLHLAVVVDEYGGTAGLVTLEDILEEVVGEIYDEDDDVEAERRDLTLLPDGAYAIDGAADLDKVDAALGMALDEEELHDYGTISGLVIARMGEIPPCGAHVLVNTVRLTVIDADDRRIVRLRAQAVSEEELEQLAAAAAEAELERARAAEDDSDGVDDEQVGRWVRKDRSRSGQNGLQEQLSGVPELYSEPSDDAELDKGAAGKSSG